MSNDITTLRTRLFETLDGIKAGTIGLDDARAINEISKTIVDSAKVEVDYLRAVCGDRSNFLDTSKQLPPLQAEGDVQSEQGRTVHRIRG